MKVKTQNLDIWRIEDSLYCKRSDGHLTRIQCNNTDLLVKVIHNIQQSGELLPPDDEYLTPESFSEIVRFLLDNEIITEVTDIQDRERTVGFVGPDDVFRLLPTHIHSDHFSLNFREVTDDINILQGLHLLLVTAPVFDNYRLLKKLSDLSYLQGIPLLYCAFGPTTFTLGPLSVSWMDTPSLNCYIKRKVVNLKEPAMYASFIRSEEKEHIATARVTSYPYFETGMNLLSVEVDRILLHSCKLSYPLMGKSYTYDFSRFTVEESTILKDPLSPLFTPNAPFTPFNG